MGNESKAVAGAVGTAKEAGTSRLRLTSKKVVEGARGPEGEKELKRGYVTHWDDELRGFGLRITKAGTRAFILQTRINGRDKRLTIGRYPGVSPEVARRRAKEMIGQIAGGGDPVADRERQRLAAVTLKEAFQDYVQTKDLKPRTVEDMRAVLGRELAAWRDTKLTKITRRMVERRYLELAGRSKARANLAFRYLNAVFNLATVRYRDAEDRPLLQDNPVKVLSEGRLWRKVGRRRTVLTPDELQRWVPAIMALAEVPDREPGQGKHNPKLPHGEAQRDLFLFLALTGCRKGEALGLEKRDVDLERDTVTFRDTKNRNDHELPLSPYLRELLRRRVDASPSDHVFASPHNGRILTNLRYSIGRVAKATGLQFTAHDLRRLAATSLERVGVPAFTIKAILNHATETRDVTGGYVVVDADMKREALEKLEAFILQHAPSTSLANNA